jgi:hypothetical protein
MQTVLSPGVLKSINEGGVAIALIITVGLFIWYISREGSANRRERLASEAAAREERGEHMKVLTNHLAHSSEAIREAGENHKMGMEAVCACMERMNDKIDNTKGGDRK